MPRRHDSADDDWDADHTDEGPAEADVDDGADDDVPDTVDCPRCGASVYEEAERCPKCGEYISREAHGSGLPRWVVTVVVVCILLGFLWRC